jgi:MFS transporter, DHA1 family, multidrug resistance protein
MDNNAIVFPKFRFFVGFAEAWAWVTFGWIVVSVAPLLPAMSHEYGVPIGALMIGVLALYSVATGTSVMLCGPLVDKYGPRKTLFVSGILLTICSLLIPVCSHTVTQIVVLRFFQGLFIGPLFAGKAAMAQRWFPHQEQGTQIGIWNAAFAVGTAVMFTVTYPLMAHFHGHWRMVAAAAAVPAAGQAILMGITLFGKEPVMVRHAPVAGAAPSKDFGVALKLPVFWAGAILLGCAMGIMQTVNGLTASYLMTPSPVGLGWKPWIAGPSLGFIQYGMIVSGVLMGLILAIIFRGKIKWLTALAFLLTGFAAYALSMSFAHASVSSMRMAFLVVGFLMNLGYPSVTTFITGNYPPPILGKVFGICGGISVYGGALFSGIAGAILDKTHTYTAVYGFVLGIGLVGCVLAAMMLNPVKAFKQE